MPFVLALPTVNWVSEPFVIFTLRDFSQFAGPPVAILLVAIWWIRVARRTNLTIYLFVPGVLWFTGWFGVTARSLYRYLLEPWAS